MVWFYRFCGQEQVGCLSAADAGQGGARYHASRRDTSNSEDTAKRPLWSCGGTGMGFAVAT